MRFTTLVLAPWMALYVSGASFDQRNPFEAVPEPAENASTRGSGPAIVGIEFRGASRTPETILRVLLMSRVGGAYDPETLRLDAQALYNTGRFSRIAWETEQSRSGPVVRFWVVERPWIHSIEYQGDDTVTIAEILATLAQRKVKLGLNVLFNQEELGRAAATVQELLVEKGRRNVTVTPWVVPIWPAGSATSEPPSTVTIVFRVLENP